MIVEQQLQSVVGIPLQAPGVVPFVLGSELVVGPVVVVLVVVVGPVVVAGGSVVIFKKFFC